MKNLQRYRRKAGSDVFAMQLDLKSGLPGGALMKYEKWGSIQMAKSGDWLVQNDGETYTVDAESFRNTYEQVGECLYRKTGKVWAEVYSGPGQMHIRTKEGITVIEPGDYVVYNDEASTDGYSINPKRFESLYELDE